MLCLARRCILFLPQASVSGLSQGKKATSASLQGKPGKVKWGLLLDSPTSAAVTAGFKKEKKNTMKKSLSTGKTSPKVCFEKKSMKKGLFGLIYPLFSLSLPRPQHCHMCQTLSPQPSGLCPVAGSTAGSCREVERDKESHFHCSLAPPAPCCPQDPPHASRYSRAPLHPTLNDAVPRGMPC